MAEGWLNDPFGRHDERFFTGGRPTRFVRSSGVDLLDHLSDDERDAPLADPAATELPAVQDEQPDVEVDDVELPPLPLPAPGATVAADDEPVEDQPADGDVQLPRAGLTVAASADAAKQGWRAVPAWKWLFATGVFILVAAAMTASVLYSSQSVPFREGPTHALTGSVTLLHQTVRGTPAEVKACAGTAAFAIVRAGAPVNVAAERKTNVGRAVLSAGAAKDLVQRGPFVMYDCTFDFRVPSVPKASFYALAVGPYSGAAVSYAQLSKMQWSLPMRLQSSRVPGGAPQLRLIAVPIAVRLSQQR